MPAAARAAARPRPPSPACRRSPAPSHSLDASGRRCMRRRAALPGTPAASPPSSEVLCQRRADLGGDRIELGAVRRVVDAHRQAGAPLEPRARGVVELEAQEMHRGGLFLVLALEVLLGDRGKALAAFDPDPDAPL